MNAILIALIVLGGIGLLLAIVLFSAARAFKVEEDPRIGQVQAVLPGANCGGCGFPGCRGFAEACVKSDSLDGLRCPVGGDDVMKQVGVILDMVPAESKPKVAVLRCQGTCERRPRTNHYDSAPSCMIASALYGGETGCSYGCLGLGDCAAACQFGALSIDPATGMPVVDEDKCTSCGACVKACPKGLFELRFKGPKSRRIYVSCRNKDKGPVAKKACETACIGCSKCQKACEFEAITIENNLAYIDFNKCRMCRKCVEECPQGSIVELNFPPRKKKEEAAPATEPKVAEPQAAPVAEPKAAEPQAAPVAEPKAPAAE